MTQQEFAEKAQALLTILGVEATPVAKSAVVAMLYGVYGKGITAGGEAVIAGIAKWDNDRAKEWAKDISK